MAEALDDAISLVGSRVALVAGPGVDNSFLRRVRQVVHSSDPFGLLVSAMTDAGLGSVPSLACAVTERGGVRLLVRGSAKVLVKTAAGASETVTARGMSTWAEQAFTGVEELVLVAANRAGATTSLVLFLDPADQRPRERARRASAAPAPAAAPVPAAPAEVPRAPAAVPHANPVPPAPVAGEPVTAAVPLFDQDGGEPDLGHLLGDTRFRGVEAAAVRPPVDEPADLSTRSSIGEAAAVRPTVPVPTVVDGDHDGNTISLSELRGMLAGHSDTVVVPVSGAPVPATPPAPAAPTVGPSVQAVTCPAGHLNPPRVSDCRSCRQPIWDRTITVVRRPPLGRIRFGDGLVVDLDRPIVLGRRPTSTDAQAESADPPRLVTVADPEQSLSRSHAELRIEGWEVLLIDRGSMNGTTVRLPGEPPTVLRPDEPCLIVPGTRVDLAGVAVFDYELPGDGLR